MERSHCRRGASAVGALVLVAAIAAIAVVGWLWLRTSPTDVGTRKDPPVAAPRAEPPAAPAAAQAANPPRLDVERAAEPAPKPVPAHASPAPAAYVAALAGLRGRLVEEDGTPIAGKKVELLELRFEPFLDNFAQTFNALPDDVGRFEVDTTQSGADGVFVLNGALADALHAVGVDLGGMRPTVRAVDAALEPGQLVELGDIVLPAALTLTGTVVDEDGAPVAGARVRALPPLPVPPQVLEFGLQDVRRDSAALIFLPESPLFLELPAWGRELLDRLPIPTTTSAADGTFRLVGAPHGLITVLVDRPGNLGVVKGGIPTGRRAEQAVGTLTLTSGQTVKGHVLAGKVPVAGARVCVGGALKIEGQSFAIGQPAGRTDASGAFSLAGLPVNGNPCVALQLDEGGPWRLFGPFEQGDVTIELPARATVTVHVNDPAGQPVDGAELRFVDDKPSGALPFMLPPVSLGANVKAQGGGTYVFDGLPFGKWQVLAHVDGFGTANAPLELATSSAELTLTLTPELRAEVRVVDAVTGAPIEYAFVSAMASEGFLPVYVAAARTDKDGRCELRRLPAKAGDIVVAARHPAHVIATAKLPSAAEGKSSVPVELRLLSGGAIAGHVRMAGAPPPKRLMVMLEPEGGREAASIDARLFRFALTDADGAFHLSHLGAGTFRYDVVTRFLAAEPATFLGDDFKPPESVADGETTVEEGKTTELEIAATPLDQLVPASVRGVVRIDGAVTAGARVHLQGQGRHASSPSVETDAAGRFEAGDLRPGEWTVAVSTHGGGDESDGEGAGGVVYCEKIRLASGETKDLVLDARLLRVAVVVRDADGRPIPDARVQAMRSAANEATDFVGALNAWSKTGTDGTAELRLASAGSWRFSVNQRGAGRKDRVVDIPAGGLAAPLELTLERGIACRGSYDFPDGDPQGIDELEIGIQAERTDNPAEWIEVDVAVDTKARTFSVAGLAAGTYHAVTFTDNGMMQSDAFVLGTSGDTQIRLHFRKQ